MHLETAVVTAGAPSSGSGRRHRLPCSPGCPTRRDELCVRFQQLTGAVMAKGVEDTAFYRYNRFIALNEVGGDPGTFGLDPEDFHSAQRAPGGRLPAGMTTLSTHDTKRGEDLRARLVVLAEIPTEWERTVPSIARAGPGPQLRPSGTCCGRPWWAPG